MIAALLAGLSLASLATAAAAAPDSVQPYRWKSRVLVVVAPDQADASLAQQRRIFRQAASQSQERDLVLVEGVGDTPQARALRQRFGVNRDGFAAILVGKDGGEKLRSAAPLEAERLFATIDAMPMRRDEMQRRR